MNQKQIQQGDVLLKPVTTKIPKDAKRIRPGKRGHVLAEGEVTGHAHCIEEVSDAELIRIGEKMLLAVENEVELKHEEHGTVTIPPGVYEVGIVQEFDYLSMMARNVAD